MAKRGKKYRQAAERIEEGRLYGPRTGLGLLKEISYANYDTTVDLHFRLGVDPRKADQMVRGAVSLPHGIGKTARVAVVASGTKVAEAQEAGADFAGGDDLVEQLEGMLDQIDSVIATPDMMGKLGRLGKVLGPRGLMPNPKSGTVTMDVAKAVTEIKAGRVEYRTDRNGNVHTILGKSSFSVDQLVDNFEAMLEEILRQRPAAAKGRYIQSVTVSTSVGPGVPLDPAKSRDLVEDNEG
jgi:large subunit ribosomal protein L1